MEGAVAAGEPARLAGAHLSNGETLFARMEELKGEERRDAGPTGV